MTDDPKKPPIVVGKTEVTTIGAGNATIEIIYESDFQSEPLWEIPGLGSWAKDKRDSWKKEDFQKTPKINGAFLEIENVETEKGIKYVLIMHNEEEKWICAGKVKPGQKCQGANCVCGYRSKYQYATLLGKQYGFKGSAKVKYGDKTLDFKLIGVTFKTHQDGKKSGQFTQIGSGTYHGYVQVRGKYAKKYGDDGLWNSLSIWFGEQKDEDTDKWIKGVKKLGKDKHGNPNTTDQCFIHPAHFPDHLAGCLALGENFSDYGFVSYADSSNAMRNVFNLIGISTRDQFKAAQKKGIKGYFDITVTDARSHAMIERLNVYMPEVSVGCGAEFQVSVDAQQCVYIQWIVKDADTGVKLKFYSSNVDEVKKSGTELIDHAEGDTLTIDCIPETWPKMVEVVAYTFDPSDGVSWLAAVKSTEVGRFIALVRKVEAEYPTCNGEQILNSLRRLAGFDTEEWQMMLNLEGKSATYIKPKGNLKQKDIDELKEMSKTGGGKAKDFFGYDVAMGHVLTGMSAGQHRDLKVDLAAKFLKKKWVALGIVAITPIGGKVDNLYASTIAGDLGHSAIEVNEERNKWKVDDKPIYIGSKSKVATFPELIGDIDGLLLGDDLDTASSITGGKLLTENRTENPPPKGKNGIRLSEVLQNYYCKCASKLCARSRFEQFQKQDMKELHKQTQQFADTYIYKTEHDERGGWVSGGFDALFSTLGEHVDGAVKQFKEEWLDKRNLEEAKRNSGNKP